MSGKRYMQYLVWFYDRRKSCLSKPIWIPLYKVPKLVSVDDKKTEQVERPANMKARGE
jgi:hypothetical protein